MLQQTQVPRVIPKYEAFLGRFPDVHALAEAKLSDVLHEWIGLGYNRRAVYLKKCAEAIVKDFHGKFPKDFETLVSLPGIGPATAGDMLLFAWNVPVPVIETNIRTVFIHFFFPEKEKVTDKEILPYVEKSLDSENPREWYWALFDYGSFLKQTGNPGRKSAHHVRQTRFEGSYRQKRAAVLRTILQGVNDENKIGKKLEYEKDVVHSIIIDLGKEGFLKKRRNKIVLL